MKDRAQTTKLSFCTTGSPNLLTSPDELSTTASTAVLSFTLKVSSWAMKLQSSSDPCLKSTIENATWAYSRTRRWPSQRRITRIFQWLRRLQIWSCSRTESWRLIFRCRQGWRRCRLFLMLMWRIFRSSRMTIWRRVIWCFWRIIRRRFSFMRRIWGEWEEIITFTFSAKTENPSKTPSSTSPSPTKSSA